MLVPVRNRPGTNPRCTSSTPPAAAFAELPRDPHAQQLAEPTSLTCNGQPATDMHIATWVGMEQQAVRLMASGMCWAASCCGAGEAGAPDPVVELQPGEVLEWDLDADGCRTTGQPLDGRLRHKERVCLRYEEVELRHVVSAQHSEPLGAHRDGGHVGAAVLDGFGEGAGTVAKLGSGRHASRVPCLRDGNILRGCAYRTQPAGTRL